MAFISTEELHRFHKNEREVFCLLIFKLHRDLTQSLLVMALWLWLHHNGCTDIIHNVMTLSHININIVKDLVDEALSCLKCLEIENHVIPNDGGLPLTKKLTKTNISLRMFNKRRYTIVTGIKSALINICARIFADLLQIILRSNNIITSGASTSRMKALNMPLVVPGFPHPLFGTFDVPPNDTMNNFDLYDEKLWIGKGPCDDVFDDDKSMFLTFSKGFPVSELEVRELFKYAFGDVVESLTMGTTNVSSNQPLYALMILKSVAAVDLILNGRRVAKLRINGKHIWARKYERRD
ncbi:hypothetical protein RJT34_02530 [Clitoria ternatea]|uniref:RRM domain-containing protein n=1 Tax=Clitoria ternatea TaxID=43366 RepID=A0AAN9KHW0_CLITE